MCHDDAGPYNQQIKQNTPQKHHGPIQRVWEHIDGAVRQCCIHRAASLQELDDMLKEYDMKRDSVEINHDAPQWSHHVRTPPERRMQTLFRKKEKF